MDWNDPIDETTDWSNVDFLNTFVAAVNERAAACSVTDGLTTDPVAAGMDVQGVPWPYNGGGYIGGWVDARPTKRRASLHGMQLAVERLVAGTYPLYSPWVRHVSGGVPIDHDGAAGMPAWWTLASIRAEAGISSGGFRRRRPREVASAAANQDTMGNAAVHGQRAWLDGQLRRYDGGAWGASDGGPVDVLDSSAPAPDHVPPGRMQAGDYIGPWIFDEARRVLNLLRHTYHPTRIYGVYSTAPYWFQNGGSAHWGNSAATFAQCVSEIQGAWDGPEGNYGNYRDGYYYWDSGDSYWMFDRYHSPPGKRVTVKINDGSKSDQDVSADAYAVVTSANLQTYVVVNSLTADMDWYAKAGQYMQGYSNTVSEFDAQGTTLLEGLFVRVHTEPIGGTGYRGHDLDLTGVCPNFPASDPVFNNNYGTYLTRGFQLTAAYAVARWNFTFVPPG